MIRRLAAGLTAAICLGIADPTPGEAAPVTFAFTGAVTQAIFDPNDPSGGEITFGTAFSGSYTFESTAPDLRADDSISGAYRMPPGAPYGFGVSFGPGHDFFTSDLLSMGVIAAPGAENHYSVFACFGGNNCPGGVTLQLFLADLDGTAFSDDALPLDLMFEAFEIANFALRGLIDGNEVEILGDLSSLSCVDGCVAPQPVPEPGTLLLLSPALAALGWRRRGSAGSAGVGGRIGGRVRAAMRAGALKVPVSAGVLAIVLGGFATNAYAVDGVVLIDQVRAMAGGVTPSDSPGFPVTINRPGSYRLASNLNVPPDAAGIVIFASGVTIDLNGFQMIGSGAGTGIAALHARRAIVVRNGSVTNFEKGIDIKGMGHDVRDVTAFNNTAIGLEIGPGATVSGNRAFSNGAGIRVESGSIVTGNVVQFNTGIGLRVAEGSVIRGNSAVQNGVGFQVVCPSALIGNTSYNNGQDIDFLGQSCTVKDNNIPLP